MGMIRQMFRNSCFDRYRVTEKDVVAHMSTDWKRVGDIVKEVVIAKESEKRPAALFVANAYVRLRMLAEDGKVERRIDTAEYRLVAQSSKRAGGLPAPQVEGLMKGPSES